MVRIQLVLISVALFVCDGLGHQLSIEQVNGENVIRIDRASGDVVRGNVITAYDYTTFQVSRNVSLTAFEIAALVAYYPGMGEGNFMVKNIEVSVDKMARMDAEYVEKEILYRNRMDTLKSADGTKVELDSPIPLEPGFFYDIKIGHFGVDQLLYKEDLQIGEFSGSTSDGEAITVNFFQKNTADLLQNFIKPYYRANALNYDITNGLCKRLYFKYE